MTDHNKLYSFDTASGSTEVTEIGDIIWNADDPILPPQYLYLNGLAVDPTDGTLYGKTAGGDNSDNLKVGHSLFKIDKTTAKATYIGRTLNGGYLTSNCKGELHIMSGGTYYNAPNGPWIYRLDKTTGESTVVGRIGGSHGYNYYSLTFDGLDDDTLHFFSDSGEQYGTSNLVTGDFTEGDVTQGSRSAYGCDIDKTIGDGKVVICGSDSRKLLMFHLDNVTDATQDVVIPIDKSTTMYRIAVDWNTEHCPALPPTQAPTSTPARECGSEQECSVFLTPFKGYKMEVPGGRCRCVVRFFKRLYERRGFECGCP